MISKHFHLDFELYLAKLLKKHIEIFKMENENK